jgi:hypothetical protein
LPINRERNRFLKGPKASPDTIPDKSQTPNFFVSHKLKTISTPAWQRTEDINRIWYERSSGNSIKDVQKRVHHPVHKWMCRLHHQDLHRQGNEKGWWTNMQISPLPIAKELWATTSVHNSVPSPTSRDIHASDLGPEALPQ